MKSVLKRLFDFQRFQKNERLEALISDTESRYDGVSEGLPDEVLDFVSAAGETLPTTTMEDPNMGKDK